MTVISGELMSQVNFWAVLVAALLSFLLGGLWYSPAMFEEVWMNANGYTETEAEQLQSNLGWVRFAAVFLAYLALTLVFALLAARLGINTVTAGLLFGFMVWLGFVATTGLAVNLFSLRKLSGWLLDAGFQLSFLLLTGAILGLWR